MKNIAKYSILLLILFNLSSCIQYKEVEVVNINNVRIKEISTKGIDVEVTMQIKNPNKYDISIVDSDLMLFLSGKKMGIASIKEKVKLKKKSNKEYRFTIQTNVKNIVSGAFPVLIGIITKSSIDLHVVGDIKAKAKGISKRVPIDVKEKVRL